MIIVAIEGLDKSGKYSQTKLLTKRLEQDGYNVIQSEFHRYDTPTGKLIRQWLYGEYKVSQQTIELIMSADKQAQQEWFQQLEDQGIDILILDRYTTSQLVYANVNNIPEWFTVEVQSFMREPDYEILIDIPAETSVIRKGKHGDNDRYESDLVLLEEVRSEYLDYFEWMQRETKKALIVNGEQSVEDIHKQIHKFILDKLKRKET